MAFSKTSTPGRFLTHVIPAVLKPLRVLWNEMIGFLFLVMAVIAAPSIWRNFQEFGRGEGSFFKFALPLALALLLVYFGLSSFFRARKISKS
jgi:hypothetical protein